jgi:hypothetical protein
VGDAADGDARAAHHAGVDVERRRHRYQREGVTGAVAHL